MELDPLHKAPNANELESALEFAPNIEPKLEPELELQLRRGHTSRSAKRGVERMSSGKLVCFKLGFLLSGNPLLIGLLLRCGR
jgi:hypothetical protein